MRALGRIPPEGGTTNALSPLHCTSDCVIIRPLFCGNGIQNSKLLGLSGLMGKLTSRFGWVLAGVTLVGCANSPWSASRAEREKLAHQSASPAATPAAAPAASASAAPGAAPGAPTDAQALQQAMAEVQQLGFLSPADQATLMADLQKTDRSLWPLVLWQFRATVAYRRQAEQRDAAEKTRSLSPESERLARQPNPPLQAQVFPDRPIPPGALPPTWPQPAGPAATPLQPAPQDVLLSSPPGVQPPPQRPLRPGDAAQDTRPAPGRQPAGEYAAVPQPRGPQGGNIVPPDPRSDSVARVRPIDRPAAEPGTIIPASFDSPIEAESPLRLAEAIRTMETQGKSGSKDDSEIARQARLRMLYLLAGRREEALRPIPGPPAMQDFWSKQMYALAVLLDTERTPDGARRAAETKQILAEALTRLGETAPLVVRNLAFCKAVQSYGCLTPFSNYEFAPGQEVVLYAEVENFTNEPSAKGFHASLRSSYQILDNRGQRVSEPESTTTDDYCQNSRRDFFIGYDIHLPKRIYPGKHVLQLTVEDLKNHKVGQSTIEFTVKDK
jgi:hypothetical protein